MTIQEIKDYLTENEWVEMTDEPDIAGFIKDNIYLSMTWDIDAIQNLFTESKIYSRLTFSIAFKFETIEAFEENISKLIQLIYWKGN